MEDYSFDEIRKSASDVLVLVKRAGAVLLGITVSRGLEPLNISKPQTETRSPKERSRRPMVFRFESAVSSQEAHLGVVHQRQGTPVLQILCDVWRQALPNAELLCIPSERASGAGSKA